MNYFSDDELSCQCGCDELVFDDDFRDLLNQIRVAFGKPMFISSGYRCSHHPGFWAVTSGGAPRIFSNFFDHGQNWPSPDWRKKLHPLAAFSLLLLVFIL